MKYRFIFTIVLMFIFLGCIPNQWKIHGGPSECEEMCRNWGLEFTAMVGIGYQGEFSPGATACVCQPKRNRRDVSLEGEPSSSISMEVPITGAEAAAAQVLQMIQIQQQQQQQKLYHN